MQKEVREEPMKSERDDINPGQANRNRLCRVLGLGRMVVSSTQMRRMRSHRLLRYSPN